MKHSCTISTGLVAIGLATTVYAAPGPTGHEAPPATWNMLMDREQPLEEVVLGGLVLPGGQLASLYLEPFDVVPGDGVVIIESKSGRRHVQSRSLVHLYRGHLVGDATATAFLSVSGKHLNGFIHSDDEIHLLSTGAVTGRRGDRLYVSPARDLEEWMSEMPFCGVDHVEQPLAAQLAGGHEAAGASRGLCTVIELAMDSDWEYTSVVFGGDAEESAAYAITLSAAVSEIYSNEMNIQFQLNFVRTWEDDSDPYDPNGDDMLNQFRDVWVAEMSWVDRDIAHVLSGRDNLPYGGVAWLGTVCNTDWGYSVSAYLAGSFPYPLEDNNWGNWDLIVMAHELGHNLGAPHTHDLGIDGCAFGDCSLASEGTIMSYCHICDGGLSNIRLGFHEQIQGTIFAKLSETSCDEVSEDIVAVDDMAETTVNHHLDIDILVNDLGASCTPDDVLLDFFDETSTGGGTITLLPAGPGFPRDRLTYDPGHGFTGTDMFSYTLVTGESADVTIEVGSIESVHEVPQDYPTVQAAINAASDGDEIRVSPGVYGDVGSAVADLMGKSIWLHSTDGPETTILDGEGVRPVVVLTGYEDVETIVEGFTIRDGYSTIGGGVRCNGTATIMNCVIRDNVGLSFAGGLMSSDIFGPTLQDVFFCNNSPTHIYGNWIDAGGNSFIDECPGGCPGDANGDSMVDVNDILAVISVWGQLCDGCTEDLDGSGDIGVDDLLQVISNWNQDCP